METREGLGAMEAMNVRQRRGLEIAARCRVVRRGLGWSVPSQSGAGKYTVTGLPFAADGEAPIPASA